MVRIVFEPTGPYHNAFGVALGETFPMVKLNPLEARRVAIVTVMRKLIEMANALVKAGRHVQR